MKKITTITIFILLFMIVGCSTIKDSVKSTNKNISTRAVRIKNITQPPPNSVKNKDINSFGDYYAILIYVDSYTNLNRLETPKLDVEALSKILTKRYGFKETKIVNNPKNSDELIAVLDSFTKKLKDNDNLLIYYAGHGSYSKETDMGFWQLKDAKIDSRVGWISLNQAINYTLNLMSARHILVLADSCYSGALVRDGGLKVGKQLNPNDKKYYSKLYKIKSRNALTSGTLQPVMDNDPKNPNHSVFANGLLFMLERNSKSIFSLAEKYPEIKRYVQLQSGEQIPIYKDIKKTGHEMGGDFIFIDRKVIKKSKTTHKKLEELVSMEPPILKDIKKVSSSNIVDDFTNLDSSVNIREQAKERALSKSILVKEEKEKSSVILKDNFENNRNIMVKKTKEILPIQKKSFRVEEKFQTYKEDFSPDFLLNQL